ncbi:hypothetical protein ASG29_03605 [Sphingomonas sp. Leaf412]|uniref:DUF6445 family protein n=1 Tax=Sphingomonas sp. Leaf412 TaxID=1736370 RepID=UPI0006FDDBC4|nr:DUF6445 family protein [Sphingomonas sp. Leaf412]KQT35209.1 hypothetical protein ASG29_03605 [Sphingomonas sp. Leaf412]
MTAPDIVARIIGEEAQPVVVVDGFHPDPDALRAAAIATPFGPAHHHYPGIRAALPDDYLTQVRGVVALILRDAFGVRAAVDVIDASFSIVTTPPDRLTVPQRLPHVDAVAPGRIALVHYLSPGGGDGTAFFRHRATGYETIDAARAPGYHAALNREIATDPPHGYVHDDTPLFARTALVEARYNRAVIYRSAMLHSGAITRPDTLPPDPATGRLTVTAFLSAR